VVTGSYWHKLFARLQATDGVQGEGPEDLLPSGPPLPSPVVALATALAAAYGLGARARRGLYARGWRPVRRLPAPVVSVGNLTVGGTGKTPVTACLGRLFQDRGLIVAILSRGYGGLGGRRAGVLRVSDGQRLYLKPPMVGEEAYWLARALPGVAVYAGACRYRAGLAAWEEVRPDLFLLDDGFQHFQLHRDLDLVLLDAASPFGNGRLLPRGPLREPVSALAAAQALVLTRYQAAPHQATLAQLRRAFPEKSLLTAAITPTAVRLYPGASPAPLEELRGRPLLAFAGLARPQVFACTLRELGVELRGFQAFPDHHPYGDRDLNLLVREAQGLGAAALITTAKDWARLGERWEVDLPLLVLEVEARLAEELPPDLLAPILGGAGEMAP
jgi:tetraacyldisaccharide 4'-kinase